VTRGKRDRRCGSVRVATGCRLSRGAAALTRCCLSRCAVQEPACEFKAAEGDHDP
jgi:hypothetical protein